ncbi:hypothetical protein ACQKMN_17095 [Ureibacillus composti]
MITKENIGTKLLELESLIHKISSCLSIKQYTEAEEQFLKLKTYIIELNNQIGDK